MWGVITYTCYNLRYTVFAKGTQRVVVSWAVLLKQIRKMEPLLTRWSYTANTKPRMVPLSPSMIKIVCWLGDLVWRVHKSTTLTFWLKYPSKSSLEIPRLHFSVWFTFKTLTCFENHLSLSTTVAAKTPLRYSISTLIKFMTFSILSYQCRFKELTTLQYKLWSPSPRPPFTNTV